MLTTANGLSLLSKAVKANNRGLATTSWSGVDDDRVIDAIEAFINGYATVETTLSLLIYHKPNFQICILNQDIADKHLIFKSHKII